LAAVSAIRTKEQMLRKLPEKARREAERAVRLRKRERKNGPVPFQGAPVEAEQGIAEKI